VLKELGKEDWLRLLDLPESRVPKVLILRGTRNLGLQYDAARRWFSNVRDLGAPNGVIESVLVGDLEGTPVGFACVYGAPMASEIVHIFGALGARAAIQIGSCGGLADALNAGDLILPSEAFCGEGAAQYYAPGKERIAASSSLRRSAAFEKLAGTTVHEGPIYTTAALLAEGEAELESWHRQGFIAVDMETAATFAVAEHFGMACTGILHVFDNPRRREHLLLTDQLKDERRAQADRVAREVAFALAVELSRAG
jgi:uridine phosphorylase